MAKSAIGAADLSLLRSAQAVQNVTVHITPKTLVQSGTITAIPSIDPFVQVTWDGSTTGVSVGQLVEITSGTTVVSRSVVRLSPSGSTLYISQTPLGSAGYGTEIETAIQVGQTVSIYSHRPLWGLYSRINQRIFYKNWSVPYSSQNLNIPPVANAGEWQCGKVASGDTTAAFTLPRDGTNTSFAMAGTVSSHLWTLPTGVSLQAGYATSDSVIEVDAEAGWHLISYRVTDSNAQTHTAYTWLFVSDGTDGKSLDERYPVSNIQVSQTPKGFTGSFTITGTSLEDVLYPGAGVLIKETPSFNGSQLTDGVFVDTHIGYVVSADYEYSEGRIASANVKFESPLVYANRIPQPEQSLTEVSGTPANWTQCTSALSNPRGALYYAMKWHTPALLDMHDLVADSMTTPRRKSIAYNTKTLGAAIDLVGKLFLKNIGSTADGTTVIKDYPQYMDNTDRNALATRITWLAQDLRLPVRYTKAMTSQVAECTTGAFAYNGTVTKAWLGGKKWNQGTGSSELPNFTVTMSEGLARILEVVGHYYAEQNRPIRELGFTLTGNQDVIDPAWMIWDRLTIASTYDPRGTGWSTNRMLANRVDRTWSKTSQGYEKTIVASFQPETFGQPGKQIPIGSARVNDGAIVVPFTPQVTEAIGQVGVMLAVNDVGQLAVTYDYLADSPQWTDLSLLFEGDVCDFDWDYNSGFFANGYSIADELSVYVCTIDGATFRVYRIYDIKSSVVSVTELTSASMADGSSDYTGRIVCSKTTPTYCIAVWHDQTGIEEVHTTDGGGTWSSKANVGNAVTDTANDDVHIGLDVFGTTTVVTAPDSTPEYGLYIATSAGGSFSAVTSTERDVVPQPMIKLLSGTVAYVTKITTTVSSTDTVITFDAGTDTNYTLDTGGGMTSGSETTGGNPDNCYKGLCGNAAANQFIQIKIDLGGATDIDDVFWDSYIDKTGGATDGDHRIVLRLSGSGTIYNNDATLTAPPDDATWHSYSCGADDSGWSPPYTCDEVWLLVDPGASPYTAADIRMDNITVSVVGGGGGTTTAATLHRVTTLTGTSVWSTVSPATDQAPVRPHDLTLDIVDSDVINTVADDDNWYQSADGASNWTTKESSTDKRTPYSVDSAIVFGGVSEVQLTLDGGTTEDEKTGNLSAVWGAVSTIKRMLAL